VAKEIGKNLYFFAYKDIVRLNVSWVSMVIKKVKKK